ncbi:uncharacterized protein TRIVIDRAFT_49486 [Trichoderma virens Gv29-8]|uniref:mRNA-capping enzyme subunit beta n=1 Tax=Hypocrea virens (strain Gv29-8 / FGSC 10586) TaxID=413071 RepID=G9N2J5_HYPVG|nr:uncharacterized protein TRIVIDRAFT_49486 [Trichoderma virens Gv29-8]EHK19305.1 hypothetical protein TRIVIDRAFT_49486 [Trichoderma virens Gv29-8]
MDLRSVLNTSDNSDRAPPRPPPAAQQQQQQQQQQPRHAPGPAQYGPGEYSHQPPPQAPPAKQPAMHDYPHPHQQPHPPQHAYPQPQPHHYPQQQLPQQQQQQQHHHQQQLLQQQQQAHQQQQRASNAYPATSPFQAPGHYQSQSRPTPVPAPPPLQPPSQYHDPRSPASSRSNSGPVIASPYRPSPTSSTTPGGSAGYPFPTQQPPDMVSPIQRQYPSQYQDPRRESYPQQSPQLATYPQQQQMRQYMPPQQQQPQPQSQQLQQQQQMQQQMQQQQQQQHAVPPQPQASPQHYGPYAQGSPVPAAQPPLADYSRHPSNSQPPTPLGPPGSASGVRQPSTAFAQPPSPYQQRMSIPAQAQAPPQPLVQAQTQPSPKPAPPPATPAHRLSSQSSHGSSPVAEPAQRPRSQQGREQSLSVSPKTRLGSIPSNPDATPASADRAARSSLSVHSMAIDSDRAVTPAKRKLEDLNMSPGELEYKETKPPPGEVNGGYADRIKKSASPIMPRKRRARHSQPPIWALSVHTLGRKLPSNVNFVLQKRIHSHINTALNGKHEPAVKAEHPSRQPSPEARRNQHAPSVEPEPQDILGPWEASITGVKPIEELSKSVADFLFMNVISNQDIQEITSRGIQFEIEAKLGTLIDKDTNQRVDRFVTTECILDDNGRVAFRSSMTEAHHKSFNDFLNNVVIQTDPRNPNGGAKRVPVIYKHRREIDRFYDLPPEMHGHLPGCVRARLGSRSRNVRVRVTYDQKTNQILNKIIKARVADIDLHMPMAPMDCRISINLEMNWDGSVEELEQLSANKSDRQPDRNKDRLSYKQGHYQIDLTQVTHTVNGPGNTQRMDKEHELEIELNHLALLEQGRRAISGAPHRYQELVEGFVDNVRVLARKAKEFAPRP